MSIKTILIVYLIAALAMGGYLYWRIRAFNACEQEFLLDQALILVGGIYEYASGCFGFRTQLATG